MGRGRSSGNPRCSFPEIKILFTSGYAEEIAQKDSVLEPGCELLVKPFTAAALAQRVRNVLDRSESYPIDKKQEVE